MIQLETFRFFCNYYHIELIFAELLLCRRLRWRKKHIIVTGLLWILYLVIPYIVTDGIISLEIPLRNGSYVMGFLSMLLLSGIGLWITFEFHSLKELVFYVLAASILQHMVYSISMMTAVLFHIEETWMSQVAEVFIMIILYVSFSFFLDRRMQKGDDIGVKNNLLIIFTSFSVFIIYIFSFWTREYEQPSAGRFAFESFCGGLLLLLLFGMFEKSKLEKQNEIMQQIMSLEEEQHKMSMENIEMINQKCHDLKHQISALRYLDNAKEQEKIIRDIEHSIMIYDMSVKTGNDALDIVLAEKSIYCERCHIRFSCIADGEKLGFMSDTDIYSLFGNAFDNAIESLCQVENPEKRIIGVHIFCKGNYLVVHIENYCSHPVVFENGLPLTTKENRSYHGYGTRSIRFLVEKYGGTVSMSAENDIFQLNILFPMEKVAGRRPLARQK